MSEREQHRADHKRYHSPPLSGWLRVSAASIDDVAPDATIKQSSPSGGNSRTPRMILVEVFPALPLYSA